MKKTILLFTFFSFQITYCQLVGTTNIPVTRLSKNYERGIKIDTLRYQFEIDTLYGKFNGPIMIWKGKDVLVKGKFKDNQKYGKWYFYDSITRKPFLIRKYVNDYNFTTLKTEIGKPEEKYPNVKSTETKLIDHPDVTEDHIASSMDYWSFLPMNKNNDHFFKNDTLWKTIKQIINTDDETLYTDHHLRYEIDKNKKTELIRNKNIEIIGFKIREYYYFDKKFANSETRTLAICPVAKINSEYKDLFWFWYPAGRQKFADTPILINNQLTTLENIFFYDNYEKYAYHRESVGIEEKDIKIDYEKPQISLIKKSNNISVFKILMDYESLLNNKKN